MPKLKKGCGIVEVSTGVRWGRVCVGVSDFGRMCRQIAAYSPFKRQHDCTTASSSHVRRERNNICGERAR